MRSEELEELKWMDAMMRQSQGETCEHATALLAGRRAAVRVDDKELVARISCARPDGAGISILCTLLDNPHRIVGVRDVPLQDLELCSDEILPEPEPEGHLLAGAQGGVSDDYAGGLFPEPTPEQRVHRIAQRTARMLLLAENKGLTEMVLPQLCALLPNELRMALIEALQAKVSP